MVDADSTFTFSRIQMLTGDALSNVYPNPIKSRKTLTVEAKGAISRLCIRDISGNNIRKDTAQNR